MVVIFKLLYYVIVPQVSILMQFLEENKNKVE